MSIVRSPFRRVWANEIGISLFDVTTSQAQTRRVNADETQFAVPASASTECFSLGRCGRRGGREARSWPGRKGLSTSPRSDFPRARLIAMDLSQLPWVTVTMAVVLLPALSAAASMVAPSIAYETQAGNDGALTSIGIHAPDAASNGPVMISIHGGGWSGGGKPWLAYKPSSFGLENGRITHEASREQASALNPSLNLARAGQRDRSTKEEDGGLWQTDQPGFHPNLTYPILYTLAFHGVGIALLGSLDKETTGFTGPSSRTFRDAFAKGTRADEDECYWNYAGHPLWGSETYLRARAQGVGPFGSFLFSAAASTAWEFGIESWYQRPSSQDLIITPVIGSLLGEARFQAKRALLEADTGTSRVLAVAVDPFQSLAEVVGRAFGQDWREPAFRKVPTGAGQTAPAFAMTIACAEGCPSFTFQCCIPF